MTQVSTVGGAVRPAPTVGVLIATIGVLGVADVVRSGWVPGSVHLAFNIGLTAVVGALAVAGRLTASELGLRNVASGARWGGAAFAAVTGAVAAAALVAPSWSVFHDTRVELSVGGMLLKVLVVIPLGTIVLEELAFRGLLLALLQRITSTRRAVLAGSLLFGMWHIPGAWGSTGSSASIADVGAVVGTVAATTVAGLLFCFLRLRSGSLLAPALAHLATNSSVFTIAWLINRS